MSRPDWCDEIVKYCKNSKKPCAFSKMGVSWMMMPFYRDERFVEIL